MRKFILSCVALGSLVGASLMMTGCDDAMFANDVTRRQEQDRLNRGIPDSTQLPPGLGDDLPPAPTTQPQAASNQ